MSPTILGLITARGGSKGLPGKNIAILAGRPLIQWSVEAALASGSLDRVVVSTDDDRIADVARAAGADVPFLRPADLAQDSSDHVDVVLHALDQLRSIDGREYTHVMLLQPTSPLRSSRHIREAVLLAGSTDADAVVSVREIVDHPYLVHRLRDDGRLEEFVQAPIAYRRRQDLPRAVRPNGAIYLNRSSDFRSRRLFIPPGSVPYFMDHETSIDVDTSRDLELADQLLRRRIEAGMSGTL